MKLYYSVLVALACYGCVSQQPKDDPYPPQDYSDKVDSRQLSSTEQTDSKVTPIIAPQTDLKTSTEKVVKKEKVIKSKVKKDKAVKNKPAESNKIALAPAKSVKSDTRQLSPTNQTESKVTKISAPKSNLKTSTETKEIKATPTKSNNVDLENSVKVDSEQLSSTNLTDPKVALIILPQTNLEEYTEQKVIEDTIIQSDNIEFNLDKLPLNFGDTWFLDRNKDSISKTTRCLLNSQKKNFNDGYTDSSISLQLSSDTLLIKTNSAIDLSYPDIGIYIDQNEPFPLEKLFGESSILIEQDTQKITTQLLDGQKLTIKLGFWPTWPQTETHSIDFVLSDFDKAYQSFQACEKL